MVYNLKNKVVLITGAATGIGSHAVRCLIEEDVKHVAILDVDVTAGNALQNELNSRYGDNRVKFYRCDVTNDDELFGAFKSTTDEHGYIDVVINNAGIMNDSLRSYKKQIEVNVTALITSSLKALELMRKDQGGKGGVIVNISSVAALSQFATLPIYNATKSAVLQFSSCLGLEDYYSKTGVRLVTVCFGVTNTSLLSAQKTGHFDKEFETGILSDIASFTSQTAESAARGLVDACKLGDSGSTWIATGGKPVKDITETVKKAYALMAQHVFDE